MSCLSNQSDTKIFSNQRLKYSFTLRNHQLFHLRKVAQMLNILLSSISFNISAEKDDGYLPYQPLPEQYPQHKPYGAVTEGWQSTIYPVPATAIIYSFFMTFLPFWPTGLELLL